MAQRISGAQTGYGARGTLSLDVRLHDRLERQEDGSCCNQGPVSLVSGVKLILPQVGSGLPDRPLDTTFARPLLSQTGSEGL